MKLCLTLSNRDPLALEALLRRHAGEVDLIEVRLDSLERPWKGISLPATDTQWIATCRPLREGGEFKGSESERLALLGQASRKGFDFIDLEYDVPLPTEFPPSVRLVRSRHVFGDLPENLAQFLPEIDRPGDVSKLAVAVADTAQAVRVLDWMHSTPPRSRVVIGMGRYGQVTRYLGGFLGNQWTYVSLAGKPVAPGQFDLAQAHEVYANDRVHAPILFGILGDPIGHSLSPRLHNRLFRHYGVDGVYLPLEVDSLERFLDFVGRSPLRFLGFSVTMPHKLAAARWLDPAESSPVRPINTLIHRDQRWSGMNTDLEGFLGPLEQRVRLEGARIVILGTGGVARTVVHALLTRGAEPIVVGRRSDALQEFAREFGCRTRLWSDLPISGQVLVNTTPVGQFPDMEASPWPGNSLDFEVVYDLVYRPRKTLLLARAEQAGTEIISGMEMFLRQAALQFLAWTGIEPDPGTLAEILSDERD